MAETEEDSLASAVVTLGRESSVGLLDVPGNISAVLGSGVFEACPVGVGRPVVDALAFALLTSSGLLVDVGIAEDGNDVIGCLDVLDGL